MLILVCWHLCCRHIIANKHVFFNALYQNGFEQLVINPTHISGSLLDHVYVGSLNGNPTLKCINIDCYYSDHDVVKILIHK